MSKVVEFQKFERLIAYKKGKQARYYKKWDFIERIVNDI